jgi:hypothetical protein
MQENVAFSIHTMARLSPPPRAINKLVGGVPYGTSEACSFGFPIAVVLSGRAWLPIGA